MKHLTVLQTNFSFFRNTIWINWKCFIVMHSHNMPKDALRLHSNGFKSPAAIKPTISWSSCLWCMFEERGQNFKPLSPDSGAPHIYVENVLEKKGDESVTREKLAAGSWSWLRHLEKEGRGGIGYCQAAVNERLAKRQPRIHCPLQTAWLRI